MKGLPVFQVISAITVCRGVATTMVGTVLAGPDFREPLGCGFKLTTHTLNVKCVTD